MIDPSLNEIFQLLGFDDEDVFNAQLRTWVPPPKPGGAEPDFAHHAARLHRDEDVRDA